VSQISFTNKITLQIQISTDKAFGFFVGTQLFRPFGNSNLSVGSKYKILGSCSMLHLWLDRNEAGYKMCVLMSQSPIVSKLETT